MPAKVFFSYSHRDEDLRDQLDRQLSILRRQGIIETWHDRRIGAGQDFGHEIDNNLEGADIILLLVSADFLDSDYCYDREMARAVARSEEGSATVIPVILRDCMWHNAPFGKLTATPPDGKPVVSWANRDQAFTEVAKAIAKAAERVGRRSPQADKMPDHRPPAQPAAVAHISREPRSSNLGLAKSFTERDRDAFLHDAFDFIARFFENSLAELQVRNHSVEGIFRRIDSNRFTATIYKDGKSASGCTVFLGSSLGRGIAFSNSDSGATNSYNENLSVEADDQTLYLKALGFAHLGGERDEKLSEQGAAEFYWAMLIDRLQ